jgi:hypothetical protein
MGSVGSPASRRATMAGPRDAGKKRRTRGRNELGRPGFVGPRERERASARAGGSCIWLGQSKGEETG